MPRRARIVIPGIPHHITQRGNHRQQIFFVEDDYLFFLDILRFYSNRAKLLTASFCLMPNHTHLISIPENKTSIELALRPTHMRYSQYLNERFGRTGINFQGRYFSSPMDEAYTYRTIQYIALNPVRAGLSPTPSAYRWSSAALHLSANSSPILTAPSPILKVAHRALMDLESQNCAVCHQQEFHLINRNTKMNIPIGSEQFVKQLEAIAGRSLAYRYKGRPRKKVASP